MEYPTQTPEYDSGDQPGQRYDADRSTADVAQDRAKGVAEHARQEAGNVTETAKQAGQSVAQTAKQQTSEVMSQARSQGRMLMDEGARELRTQAGHGQQRLAEVVRSLSGELDELLQGNQQSGPVTELAENARSAGHRTADWLERNSPDDVLDSVRRYAARNPWTFMAICAGIGFVGARLARGMQAAKTDDRDRFDEQRYYSSGGYQSGGSYSGVTEEYPPRLYGQNQTTYGQGQAYSERVQAPYGQEHGQGQAPSGQAPTTYGQAGNLEPTPMPSDTYERVSSGQGVLGDPDAPGDAVGTAETEAPAPQWPGYDTSGTLEGERAPRENDRR